METVALDLMPSPASHVNGRAKYYFALYITLFVECTLNVNMGIDKLLNTVLNISQPQLTLLYSSLIE